MVNTYKYNDTTQLTDHFNVQEFRCKCGQAHDILINPELVEKLEQLHKKLHCSKIIVNSGHRCAAHDIAVKGSGTGQHVSGNAADIVCYDSSGNKISSKIISCVAQDIGFKGIANIDKQYNATHVDVRLAGKWLGDEVETTVYSVTEDFYDYYGLSKSDVYGASESASADTLDISITLDGKTYSGTLTAK